MKIRFLNRNFAALLLLAASSAYATPLTYTFTGPQFDYFSGPGFNVGDGITGTVSFDSSLLSPSGTGSFNTNSGSIIPGITWQFQDGHNLFNNTITTTNFALEMSFTNFAASTWNVDTTFGVTSGADIFVFNNNSNFSAYESYYQGGYATSSTLPTSANWVLTTSNVPETSAMPLLGLGLGFLGLAKFLVRRSQA